LLIPCVPLKKIKPIINNCPKGMKVTNCHQPLEFKSCSRRWVTKNTWITEDINIINKINNKNTASESPKILSVVDSYDEYNLPKNKERYINTHIIKNRNIYS